MQIFFCEKCGHTVFFENTTCEQCGVPLGFDPVQLTMKALIPGKDGLLATAASSGAQTYCDNYKYDVCNWLVSAQEPTSPLCLSCGLNRTIPDLDVDGNVERWFEFEKAKRRLIYGLLRLNLPINLTSGPESGPQLVFDILADAQTGHEAGVITMNVSEADDSVRESIRAQFNEPYRTLIGHFRHEIGHYYWEVLVKNSARIDEFRDIFGDERTDYAEMLAAYHTSGPKPDWENTHISAYASAHPWEDWAESWAHYLHMVDALETANSYSVSPSISKKPPRLQLFASSGRDPYTAASAQSLLDAWVPLSLAINDLNRSMGLSDFYPFVISPSVAKKLEFIHSVIKSSKKPR